jgi:hypothetical protein
MIERLGNLANQLKFAEEFTVLNKMHQRPLPVKFRCLHVPDTEEDDYKNWLNEVGLPFATVQITNPDGADRMHHYVTVTLKSLRCDNEEYLVNFNEYCQRLETKYPEALKRNLEANNRKVDEA